jgi:hypothetical protein
MCCEPYQRARMDVCVEHVRTGMSKEDTILRVMFDTIRDDTIILHTVTVKLEL